MHKTQNSKSSVLLVNCWHDSNKGDAAISIGVVNALKRNFVADIVRVASYIYYPNREDMDFGFRHVRAAHPDVEFVQTTFPALSRSVGKFESLKLAFRAALKLLVPSLIPDRGFEKAIREARVVVSNGGLYFGFAKDGFSFILFHLFAFSYPMLLAKRCGVPYVLYAQSFGPFRDRLSRWWMKWLVTWSAGTWARESFSRDALLALGAPAEKVNVVADAAFGLSIDGQESSSVLARFGLQNRGYVAISARGLDASGHSAEAEIRYRESIGALMEWLANERGLRVALVAHTTGPVVDEDDRITSRAIFNSLPAGLEGKVLLIDEDLRPEELAHLYGSADFIIATRFHAVVLALCGGAPAIAIPYFGVKTQGSMRDLGLSDFLLEVRDLTAETLKEKCAYCLNDGAALKLRIKRLATERYSFAMQTGKTLSEIAAR
jgi:colanic acid/amylovoran biosynthesis protein